MEAADKGKAYSDDLVKGVRRRPTTEGRGEKLLSLITPADHADLADCDLVIEAVFEDRDVKKAVTESIEAQMKTRAIYASNTSTLPITGLGEELEAAEELHRHPLLLAGRQDDAGRDHSRQAHLGQGARRGARLCRAIKKTPIVVNDTAASTSTAACCATCEGLQHAGRGRAAGDDRERRQDGRHAGRPAVAQKFTRKWGPRFKPNKLLREMAKNNETFYGRFPPKGESRRQRRCLIKSSSLHLSTPLISGKRRFLFRSHSCLQNTTRLDPTCRLMQSGGKKKTLRFAWRGNAA
jgi:hypothetical protein